MAKKQPVQPVPASLLPPAPPMPTNYLCICVRQGGCQQALKSRLIAEVGPEQGIVVMPNGEEGTLMEPAWAIKSPVDSEYGGKWLVLTCCPFCAKRINS